MSQERVVAVSSVLQRIKVILTETFDFSRVWIQGEISNLTKHRSGHYYFSLKDDKGEMNCVMFSSYVRYLDFSLEEGMSVQVQASVNVYEPRGSLQLYVRNIRQDGLGALYLEYQKRYKKLKDAGYFLDDHKKSKPEWFDKIAIITAKEGAALQDALKTFQRRWPMLQIDLYPSYVQGNLAPKSLIRAIQKADQKNYDALLIIRGGGSFEDLFCFNDENLVKTLYECKTYTVSGVGHEVDTTLCDLVCDHRAVTPTAAAQWVTPDQVEIAQKIRSSQTQIENRIQTLLQNQMSQLKYLQNHPYLRDPLSWVYEKKIHLDHAQEALDHSRYRLQQYKAQLLKTDQDLFQRIKHSLHLKTIDHSHKTNQLKEMIQKVQTQQKQRFSQTMLLLDACSPLKILERGYSVALKEGKPVHDIKELEINDPVKVVLEKGSFDALVLSKEEKTWLKNN